MGAGGNSHRERRPRGEDGQRASIKEEGSHFALIENHENPPFPISLEGHPTPAEPGTPQSSQTLAGKVRGVGGGVTHADSLVSRDSPR